ncbi:hypothetical protein A3197_05425 [Candidatus Thiodiazotropha endoloripes]|nr:hypothetical protein A3197_05425 [Candidatus Thiodiazotropha endoloripes]
MPATTIKEVIERMDELLARWEAHGDYHAIFVRSYRIITIAMEQAIAAGEFEDPGWILFLPRSISQRLEPMNRTMSGCLNVGNGYLTLPVANGAQPCRI